LQVTGAVIAEDVELEGELLYRWLDEDDTEFTFTATDTGAIAAAIFVYRGVDSLEVIDVQAETVESGGGSTTHDAPSVTTTQDDVTLMSLYFLWNDSGGGTVAGGQIERLDLAVVATGPSPDRDISLLVGDETFATPGATGVRQATTVNSGIANNVTLALTGNIDSRTAFDREVGSTQGRIAPVNFTQTDAYAFVLGRDIAGQMSELAAGDYVEVSQSADFDTVVIVSVTVRLRAGEAVPAGVRWKFSIRIDGAERASQLLQPNVTRDATFAANVEQLGAGDHELAFRLELASV
jgi:hypothetical protein